jgi:hypothetical protein
MTFNLDATANNVGMAWRQVSSPTAASRAPQITGVDTTYVTSPIGYSVTSATLNTDGSATVRVNAQVTITNGSVLGALGAITCVLGIPVCYKNTISVPIALINDHPLVDSTNTTYNWFFRNRWQEVAYYALAPGIAPSGARSCANGSTCLQLTYHPSSGKQRAIVILGGAKLLSQVRPAASATDLMEGANASADASNPLTLPFALRSPPLAINRSFNDHVGIIDSNP